MASTAEGDSGGPLLQGWMVRRILNGHGSSDSSMGYNRSVIKWNG